ncbi:MAG TPA: FAD-dependent oxidoreductase [Thermoanaerobaculia bacterium]|nr:FAD-dependent oxidoreductase [Thermoanaerobaculia bacterium]
MNRPRETPQTVLIVGAGVAGLVAARTLADHGLEVTIVDKFHGVGGRLATRRLGDGASFDHGAALFDPVSEPFRRQLAAWEEDGLVERTGIDGRDGVPTRRVKGPATSLAKHLARGLDIRLGAKGVALARDGGGFTLTLEDGTSVHAAAALLSPPVPQSLELLDRGGLLPRIPDTTRAALQAVSYHPAFVLMLRLDRRLETLPPSGILLLRDGGPVARVFENARDGGPSRLSVFTRGEWATSRYDAPPGEVSATLKGAVATSLGFEPSAVVEEELKRWRFARAVSVFPEEAAFVDLDGAPLVLAGDAFGAPGSMGVAGGARPPLAGNTGLERAFLSGLAAAGRLLGFRA